MCNKVTIYRSISGCRGTTDSVVTQEIKHREFLPPPLGSERQGQHRYRKEKNETAIWELQHRDKCCSPSSLHMVVSGEMKTLTLLLHLLLIQHRSSSLEEYSGKLKGQDILWIVSDPFNLHQEIQLRRMELEKPVEDNLQ